VKLDLADFLDYIFTAGMSRIKVARRLVESGSAISTDFYKPLREAVVDMHQRERGSAVLDEVLTNLTDPRAQRVYPRVIDGYKRFLAASVQTTGDAKVGWFEPPAAELDLGGTNTVSIGVRPELGLIIGGRPHILKLYLRGDPLSVDRLIFTNDMLRAAFEVTWPGVVLGVVDVRRGRLLPSRPNKDARLLLQSEAVSLHALAFALALT
jgi:hypothetical protein